MNMKMKSSIVFVSLFMAACGDGSGGSHGAPDATSRKNALNASLSSGSSASKKTNGNQKAMAMALSTADASKPAQGAEFSGDCEKGGSLAGKVTAVEESETKENMKLTLDANFDQCAPDENGRVSGNLSISLSLQNKIFSMSMTGKVVGEGKNAAGEFAEHQMEFKGLSISFPVDSVSSSNGLPQFTCTGSLVLDGQETSCADAMKGSPQAAPATQAPSSASTPTGAPPTVQVNKKSLIKEVVNGRGRMAFIFEDANLNDPSIESVKVVSVKGESSALKGDEFKEFIRLSAPVREELSRRFLTIRPADLNQFSVNASGFTAECNEKDIELLDHVEVTVLLSNGSRVIISSK